MNFKAKFRETNQSFAVGFLTENQDIVSDFGEVQTVTKYIGGELYEGDYFVTPKTTAQTIPTKDKVMVKDMTVNSIPFFNVSNTSGGTTAYIGSEV